MIHPRMWFRRAAAHTALLLACIPATALADAVPPVPLLPFSWDHVPYFVHCSNSSGPVSPAILDLQANAGFTVIQIQQGMDEPGGICPDEHDPVSCNATGAEAKCAAAAARIKAKSPAARVLLYYTCDNVRVESDFGRSLIKSHPELLLEQLDHQTGKVKGYLYDWSQPATAEVWAKGIAAAVALGNFSGVFIDGYDGWHECFPPVTPPAPPSLSGTPSGPPWRQDNPSGSGLQHKSGCPIHGVPMTPRGLVNQTAFLTNKNYRSGIALRAALPASSVMIPNCEGGYGCRDGKGASRLPGFNAVGRAFKLFYYYPLVFLLLLFSLSRHSMAFAWDAVPVLRALPPLSFLWGSVFRGSCHQKERKRDTLLVHPVSRTPSKATWASVTEPPIPRLTPMGTGTFKEGPLL